MTLNTMTKAEFFDFAMSDPQALLHAVNAGDAYIVKGLCSKERIKTLRAFFVALATAQPASWHPCKDGCPDYHRIHQNYPQAYVTAVQHGWYFHRWNQDAALFDEFKVVFDLKCLLAGVPPGTYYDSIPSDLVISRIVVHQYPRGGGGQAAHVDPTSDFARIQTIVQGSQYGTDYISGGNYFYPAEGADKVHLDPLTDAGDMLVMSPSVVHGVDSVDPEFPLDWSRSDGRWIIMPIIIHSDHHQDPDAKPRMMERAR
jgi:hypothetical protein